MKKAQWIIDLILSSICVSSKITLKIVSGFSPNLTYRSLWSRWLLVPSHPRSNHKVKVKSVHPVYKVELNAAILSFCGVDHKSCVCLGQGGSKGSISGSQIVISHIGHII